MRQRNVGIQTMATVWTTAALALALALAPSALGQPTFDNRWHVDRSVVGGDENGIDWANAFKDLQDALFEAGESPGTDEIWVAAGIYYPDSGTLNRNASFGLVNRASVYGGFLGTSNPQHPNGEDELTQRDPENNITMLSGDIDQDDLLDADNSLHVVTAREVIETAVLNGFTISGGFADGFGDDERGGGILIANGFPPLDAGPTVVRCRLTGNFADEGGGIHVTGPFANPTLVNCSFISNDAREGGGMHLETGDPQATLVNCVFADNAATEHAGALDVGGDVAVVNCTFTGNSAPAGPGDQIGGGAIWAESGEVTVTSSVLWDNVPNQIEIDFGSPVVTYSDVQGGWEGTDNIDADPMFCDASGGNFRLQDVSPCIDAGDDGAVPERDEGDVDDDGVIAEPLPWDADTAKPASHHGRVFNVESGPGETRVDMGAYENQHIRDCPWDIASEDAGPPPDGDVGINDFLRLLGDWGSCPGCGADFDCNLVVDTVDFLALNGNWGPCPASSPSSFGGGSLGEALWLMGFTDPAAYEAWVLEATDAEAYVSMQILAELLLALD
jgi:hypothetical protein